MRFLLLAAWAALISDSVPLSSVFAEEPVDFGRDIRQILSDKCFLCHGPDEDTREADLRLDHRDAAIEFGAFEPGNADDSEAWTRINSDDPDLVMPPPATGKQITADERALIRAWINQGAEYSEHWAYVPPIRPEVPDVETPDWGNNPIDAFVYRRAKARGLVPAQPAKPIELVRRLYLDLIGLPPSPEQLAEVDQDFDERKLAALAERLLQSEHFGERWARWWLDAARYADSDGYEKDKPRSVWFYRDWVLRAMNDNKPYDEFIVEQIAGDLLPGAGQDELVATGFLRNSMVNEEGGADPEQFRVEGMFDRMDAIGKAILGITTQCAQCHSHKYDPLTQQEYYQMFAALNDFHEASISVFTPEQSRQRDEVFERIADIEDSAKRKLPDWLTRLEQWQDSAKALALPWRVLTPTDLPFEGQKFEVLEDGSILSQSYAPTRVTNTFRLTTEIDKISAFRLDVLQHPQLPRGGPGRSVYGTGALTEFNVKIAPVDDPKAVQTIQWQAAYSDANPEHTALPAIYRDRDPSKDTRVTGPIEYAIDGDTKTAWSTDVGPGRRNQNRHAIFVPKQPIEMAGQVVISFELNQSHGGWNSDDNQNYLLGRYRFSMTSAEIPDATLPSDVESILLASNAPRDAHDHSALFSHWLTTVDELSEERVALEHAWQQFPETDTQLVVQSLGRPRPTYVFNRGDFLNRGPQVTAGTPGFLGGVGGPQEHPRLQFAKWLVRRDAPTTARVIVNRIWQAYFGRGIVSSPEDFGFQSSAPTHPDLLDWLAVELMENNWELKHIHRLIVQSATYQQSSRVTSAQAQLDPMNQWLARGPRFRVNAEIVRDIALSVSGLLNPDVGGPSVYPPAPAFLFQPPASYGPKTWNTSTDGNQYRRSLYVHRFRSVPYPALQVFDAPKGDAACIRRERSNTPMQALVLLNEPQFVECARGMAGRVIREGGEADVERLQYAHRLVVGRNAEPEELNVLLRLLQQQRLRLSKGELEMEPIMGVESSLYTQLTGQRAQDTVPWVIVCRALLNLDETITKP